mmetsp:Transcript_46762/g.146602  ORF Transcript_46762/g.146602 Transcript_46762/m.146602 type:complete len:268 (-) Transcript_46762:52-855(-)
MPVDWPHAVGGELGQPRELGVLLEEGVLLRRGQLHALRVECQQLLLGVLQVPHCTGAQALAPRGLLLGHVVRLNAREDGVAALRAVRACASAAAAQVGQHGGSEAGLQPRVEVEETGAVEVPARLPGLPPRHNRSGVRGGDACPLRGGRHEAFARGPARVCDVRHVLPFRQRPVQVHKLLAAVHRARGVIDCAEAQAIGKLADRLDVCGIQEARAELDARLLAEEASTLAGLRGCCHGRWTAEAGEGRQGGEHCAGATGSQGCASHA